METRLGAVETRLGAVETRLGAVETRLGAVEHGLRDWAEPHLVLTRYVRKVVDRQCLADLQGRVTRLEQGES